MSHNGSKMGCEAFHACKNTPVRAEAELQHHTHTHTRMSVFWGVCGQPPEMAHPVDSPGFSPSSVCRVLSLLLRIHHHRDLLTITAYTEVSLARWAAHGPDQAWEPEAFWFDPRMIKPSGALNLEHVWVTASSRWGLAPSLTVCVLNERRRERHGWSRIWQLDDQGFPDPVCVCNHGYSEHHHRWSRERQRVSRESIEL